MAALGSRAGNLIYSNRQEDTLNQVGRRLTFLQQPVGGVVDSGFLADVQLDFLFNGYVHMRLLNNKPSAVESGPTGGMIITVSGVPELETLVATSQGGAFAVANSVPRADFTVVTGVGVGTGQITIRIGLYTSTQTLEIDRGSMGIFPFK